MAWNEPGGSRDNDPWGNRGGNRGNKQSPPDLDEMIRKMQQKLGGLFGGKGGGRSEGPKGPGTAPAKIIGVIAGIAVVVWVATGIYIVDEGTRGVVTRFGQYVDTTLPGPHWHIPVPIEAVQVVNVEQIRTVEIGYRSGGGGGGAQAGSISNEALMLTKDENIINVKFAVQYKVKDARDYLFNTRDPDAALRQATESAVRDAVGKNNMDFVLKEGRSEIGARAIEMIQKTLDRYGAGLQVSSLNMQDAQPPEEVQSAFLDAVKSREDEQRLINEAEAYANDVIPKARGGAARQIEEANGYKAQVVAQAKGEASRFDQVLTEYQKAPKVMRDRLYIEAMESVLSKSSKVMVDVKGGNNLLYLPLDRITQRQGQAGSSATGSPAIEPQILDGSSVIPSDVSRARDSLRAREQR